MKKFVGFCVIFALILSLGVGFASEEIKLSVNGQLLTPEVPPQVVDGRTLIPARSVSEALGAQVEWIPEERTVKVTRPDPLLEAATAFAADIPQNGAYKIAWADVITRMDQANFKVLDVRTKAERTEGRVPGSLGIPLAELTANLDKLSKDTTYAVHCAVGIRAGYAVTILRMMGYNALLIPDGPEGYEAAGGSLECGG